MKKNQLQKENNDLYNIQDYFDLEFYNIYNFSDNNFFLNLLLYDVVYILVLLFF